MSVKGIKDWEIKFYPRIKIKADRSELVPEAAHGGEWYDLKTKDEVVLTKDNPVKINLGVRIGLPEGYEALLAPRSSTFGKYGILQTNSIGVIDNKYRGNDDVWMMSVYPTRDAVIPAGTRIAQFRIIAQQPEVVFDIVDDMEGENRGGFGSTGN